MATHDVHKFRNIGIVAHIHHGKLQTTEPLLFYSGITQTLSEEYKGTAVIDWMEQDHNISISSVATGFSKRNESSYQMNNLDLEGRLGFMSEVLLSQRNFNGAVDQSVIDELAASACTERFIDSRQGSVVPEVRSASPSVSGLQIGFPSSSCIRAHILAALPTKPIGRLVQI